VTLIGAGFTGLATAHELGGRQYLAVCDAVGNRPAERIGCRREEAGDGGMREKLATSSK